MNIKDGFINDYDCYWWVWDGYCWVLWPMTTTNWYEPTNYARWDATGENWVCRRCGKAIKSVWELIGTKGKLSIRS